MQWTMEETTTKWFNTRTKVKKKKKIPDFLARGPENGGFKASPGRLNSLIDSNDLDIQMQGHYQCIYSINNSQLEWSEGGLQRGWKK